MRTDDERQRLVKKYFNSGQKIGEYCRRQQIPYNTFKHWVHKYQKQDRNMAFAEVVVDTPFAAQIEIELPHKIIVRVTTGLSHTHLKPYIQELMSC